MTEVGFAPGFWDGLSKVWLTPHALREIDRRQVLRLPQLKNVPEVYPKELARFARHGGPDFSHLRSWFNTENCSVSSKLNTTTMPSKRHHEVSGTDNQRVLKNFLYSEHSHQYLTDHSIYEAKLRIFNLNISHEQKPLRARRASLTGGRFTDAVFNDFVLNHINVVFERDVMKTIIPVICGSSSSSINSQEDVLFTEFDYITDPEASKPKPDFFDGACLQDLHMAVRSDKVLQSKIIPSKHRRVPVAPNFFLEVKGPSGITKVGERQVRYYGAFGARAMHALQNYGQIVPTYDEKVYTYSALYTMNGNFGHLQLYGHHISAPKAEGEQPGYHMIEIGTWIMSADKRNFTEGATMFRNARLLAKKYRDTFIQAANDRARLG